MIIEDEKDISLTLDERIDANKSGYIPYFDYIMDHNMLADRGIIIADNGMWMGIAMN